MASESGTLQIVAEAGGQIVGLGRLVPITDGVAELGGIGVAPEWRNRNIARAVVTELIARAAGIKLWCLPFAELEAFYASFGFTRTLPAEAPAGIQEKLAYCAATYPKKTLLMRR